MPNVLPLVAAAVSLVLVAGCNDDGRTLAPAPTVPVSELTTTTAGPGDTGAAIDPGGLTLISSAFVEGAALDAAYTCDGVDVPPPLSATGVPEGTAELALTVTDTDAGGFVHWVIAGLPPSVTTIESGLIPPEAVTARTDSGVDGWSGPCPPPGDAAHHYVFTVYAMPEPVGLAPGLDGRDAIFLLQQAAAASDELVATYTRAEQG